MVREEQLEYVIFLERKQLKQSLWPQYLTRLLDNCAGSRATTLALLAAVQGKGTQTRACVPAAGFASSSSQVEARGDPITEQIFVRQAQLCWAMRGSMEPRAVLAGVEQKWGLVLPCLGSTHVEEVSFPAKLCWAKHLLRCCWYFLLLLN